ncbi:MAG: GTP-binding protein [Nitrospiraceae bacterium]
MSSAGKDSNTHSCSDAFWKNRSRASRSIRRARFSVREAAMYRIIDAPGHKEFLKNMISGAARAEAALLLIDALEGVKEQSKKHSYLLSLLGVRQFAVVVNKMDLVGYRQDIFEGIEKALREFLGQFKAVPRQTGFPSARMEQYRHSQPAHALVQGTDGAQYVGAVQEGAGAR